MKKLTWLCVAFAIILALALVAPNFVGAQAKTAKDTVILKGSPLGGVKFEHKLHADTRDTKCEVCHHASKPEKPAASPQQVCSDCHNKAAQAPMKTNYQGAFHKPTGQTGLCLDCHKTVNAQGKKAPAKCTECHQKANV